MDVAARAIALEPSRHVSEHRVVRASSDGGMGRAPGRARGLAPRTDELGALGSPRRGGSGSFAGLVGVPVETVAIAANVSTLLGMVAASVADGACVLAPDIEFTSVLFPFMARSTAA